jgi:hypothetical protein
VEQTETKLDQLQVGEERLERVAKSKRSEQIMRIPNKAGGGKKKTEKKRLTLRSG